MNRFKLICFLLLLSRFVDAQVVINEVCPANADINHDPDFFNFSGWIELFNSGSDSKNLGGYSILIDNFKSWQIPNGTSIAAKGFLLIWCDNKKKGLHSDFDLDSDGQILALIDNSGNNVDEVEFPEQFTNISYGRLKDGGVDLGYLVNPTPQAPNNNESAVMRLSNPEASLKSGRYTSSQSVTLSHENPKAEIHFTTDGSEPNKNSPVFKNAIPITKTTTVKAKAFLPGKLPSKTEVKTYFINEHVFNLPVVSITTDPQYLWDNTIGIYVVGTNGVIDFCAEQPANWNRDWTRHAVLEMFNKDGSKRFDQSVDIRIGGACSRNNPQKSFVVKARDKYGKNTINEKLFPTRESSKFGGFILRNGGNDFWFTLFRDEMMQHLVVGQMDLDYLDYQPTIFYLNGEYWGIQDIREKIDADYFKANFDVNKDDLDLGEWSIPLEGSVDSYFSYVNTLQTMDIASDDAFAFIDKNIDVQEYINYVVTEIYDCNTDWPGNNMKYWRDRSGNNKWRWVLWDLDFGFGLYGTASYATHPTLEFATATDGPEWPNPPWSTLHFRLLLKNPEFKKRFIETFAASLSTTYSPSRVIGMIDDFQDHIKPEMSFHTNRWNLSMVNWSSEVQRLRIFASERNSFMYQHLKNFFNLGDLVTVKTSVASAGTGAILFNGITSTVPTEGSYFRNLSYKLSAVPETGYKFKQWNLKKIQSTNVDMIDAGSVWKYFDQGPISDPEWNSPEYNDAGWPEGPAELGYGDGNENTVIGYGPDAQNKFITTYFRKTFDLPDTVAMSTLSGSILFDDGAIVYLNGNEVFRANMPEGPIDANIPATVSAEENVYIPFTIPRGIMKPGSNTLGVEIHQNGATSSDVSFDLQLKSVRLGDGVIEIVSDPTLTGEANSDLEFTAEFEPVVAQAAGIVINEFSAGKSTLLDERNEAEDWIELYNSGTQTVDISGFYITDDLANKTKYKIKTSNDAKIAAGQYRVLWADEETAQGPLHLNLKLSDSGEDIGLYQMVGSDIIKVDELTYTELLPGNSYSRIPNATGPFELTSKLTPLETNELEAPVAVENPRGEDLNLYPNPAKESLRVYGDVVIDNFTIYNIAGQQVISAGSISPGEQIKLNDLSTGLYVAKFSVRGKVIIRRFVKND